MSKWNDANKVEQVVWDMRLADLPRGENRALINRQFNGDPPYSPEIAEENNIQINRSSLEGVNLMSQSRRQWHQGFMPSGNYFSVKVDAGPPHKNREWSHTITKNANRYLKRNRSYMEQSRATGASMLLHGIGPVMWDSRRGVVPEELDVASVLTPSETRVNLKNLTHLAIFREWTPAQLYAMTHGPKVDPGWDMAMVKSQLKYVGEQTQKQPNATAFQYMPERIEELLKQDLGFWGSDAVPTIDAWDFYFLDDENDGNIYRRIILDWGVTEGGALTKEQVKQRPVTKDSGKFLYSSGDRKFASSFDEIIHFQFADCSCVPPFRIHSIRSLGWMLWGICDLQDRLHCKFNENVFQQMMWFFRTASNADLIRLRKADFYHMATIPQGIEFIPASERFKPDVDLLNMAFARNRQLMSENAAGYTQDFTHGQAGTEKTATETMALVNKTNALVSGMMQLAYTYEEFKDREICRRLCIKGNPDPLARDFRLACLKAGVPPEMLDVERWDISRERVLGAGNKTIEMAEVQFLQSIRKNLGPDAQRRVDHISIESATDSAMLAEELAPVDEMKHISKSANDAQNATQRIMAGLPYHLPPDAVAEDFVLIWMMDLAALVQHAQQTGGMVTTQELTGMRNLIQHIAQLLSEILKNPEEKARVKAYGDQLKNLANYVKAFEQRLAEQAKARNGGGQQQPDPKDIAKAQSAMMLAKIKMQNTRESHAARTAQKQISFEMEEQRRDRELNAELRREGLRAGQEMMHSRLKAFDE